MNNENNQLDDKVDKIIDEAVENAESRRELSENELDEIAGAITACSFMACPKNL